MTMIARPARVTSERKTRTSRKIATAVPDQKRR
jgi:hypothetical protein